MILELADPRLLFIATGVTLGSPSSEKLVSSLY